MMVVVRPSVRDRWLASQLSYFTPAIVENTARGAMAGNLLAQWLMFDLMEQTWPRLSKNLNELKNAVVDLDWKVQAHAARGRKPSPEAHRRARIVEELIWSMRPELALDENDFEDTLRDVLDAVGKGISVLEIDWEQRPPAELGLTGTQSSVLWAPRATRWVHPRYYGYPSQPGTEDRLMLNTREVRSANPAALPSDPSDPSNPSDPLHAPFPRDQFIVSVFKQKSGHPISGALLRILGFWWAASNFCWEWFLNLAQIFGVPIRWANYATGTAKAETITAIEEMLAQLGSAGWAAFPEGTKLEIKEALNTARDNPSKAFIDAADLIADTLILGQTLTTTQGDRGSQSLGTVHKAVRDEKVMATAKRAAKILNLSFLPAICRLNFGDEAECPWLQPSEKRADDAAATASRFKTLLTIPGVQISKQQFYEENGLIMPEAGDEVMESDLPPISPIGPIGPTNHPPTPSAP